MLRAEFERLTARQPMEVLSMKRSVLGLEPASVYSDIAVLPSIHVHVCACMHVHGWGELACHQKSFNPPFLILKVRHPAGLIYSKG